MANGSEKRKTCYFVYKIKHIQLPVTLDGVCLRPSHQFSNTSHSVYLLSLITSKKVKHQSLVGSR